ncbi:hypothetical protein HPP92_026896, partial [Vanilla planifolia]
RCDWILVMLNRWSTSRLLNPVNPIEKQEEVEKPERELKFYNSEMHKAAFALPSFVTRELSTLNCLEDKSK